MAGCQNSKRIYQWVIYSPFDSRAPSWANNTQDQRLCLIETSNLAHVL